MINNPAEYLTSKETKVILKIQDCELMHLRQSGKLKFIKKGNAYLYIRESIENITKNKQI